MKNIIIIFIFILNTLSFCASIEVKFFQQGTNISALSNSLEKYFFLSDNWKIKEDPIMRIEGEFSNLTTDSEITFFINDIPFKSIKIDPKETLNIDTYVKIPKKFLKYGVNKLTLSKVQKLRDNCSLELDSSSSWFRIDNSTISIEYEIDNDNTNLYSFPTPFVDENDLFKSDNTIKIVMPKEPTPAEKVFLSNFSVLLGKLTRNRGQKIEIIDFDNLNNTKDNFIYISEYNNLEENLKKSFIFDNIQSLSSGIFFKLLPNPNNEKNKILIVTGTEKSFFNNQISNLNKNNFQTLPKNVSELFIENKIHENNLIKNKRTLSLEGIGNINLSKIGRDKTSFSFRLPIYKKAVFLELILKLRVSELVVNNNSTLSISVNGIKINDVLISDKTEFNDFHIKIPKSEYNKKELYIELELNSVLKLNCLESLPKPWVTILNESELVERYEDKDLLTLKDFPAPLIKDNSFNNLGVSVSNDIKSIGFFAEIFKYIGDTYPATLGKINYLEKTDDLNNVSSALVIGNPLTNNIIAQNKTDLFVTYDSSEKNFIQNNNTVILVPYIYSAIQLIEKESKKIIYVVTDKNNYYENILNNILNENIDGDAYLSIGLSSGINYYLNNKFNEIKQFNITEYKLVFFILSAVIAIFILLIFYFSQKRK